MCQPNKVEPAEHAFVEVAQVCGVAVALRPGRSAFTRSTVSLPQMTPAPRPTGG